jgi:hypothetical protein
MGRPPIELSKRDLRTIEGMAALGRTVAEIALALGFSERTFHNKKAVDDEVFSAWQRGRLKGVTSVAAVTFRNAMEGDQRAAEFYLGAFHGITVRTPQGTVTPGLEGVPDQDDPFQIADPHDELLRRYDEIAKRQEATEAAASEVPADRPHFTPREHMPEDDAPPETPHRQEGDHAA